MRRVKAIVPEAISSDTTAFYCGDGNFHPRISFLAAGDEIISEKSIQFRRIWVISNLREWTSVAKSLRNEIINITVHFNLFIFLHSRSVSLPHFFAFSFADRFAVSMYVSHVAKSQPADAQRMIACTVFSFSIMPQSSPLVNYVIKLGPLDCVLCLPGVPFRSQAVLDPQPHELPFYCTRSKRSL